MLKEKSLKFEEYISFQGEQTILHASVKYYPKWEAKTRNDVLRFIMEEIHTENCLRKHLSHSDKDDKLPLHYIAEDPDLTHCFFENLQWVRSGSSELCRFGQSLLSFFKLNTNFFQKFLYTGF